jgi:hypothetical protein
MAKVTITFEDKSNGRVDCKTRFAPALCKGKRMTPAQQFGFEIAKSLGGDLAKPAMEAIDQNINGDTAKA